MAKSPWKQERDKRHVPALGYSSSLGATCIVRPASHSMHKTSLHYKDFAPEPKISALDRVREALERDAREQVKKYGSEVPDPQSARFNVQLPRSPQHEKYSWMRAKDVGDSDSDYEEEIKAEHPEHMRFNQTTLRNWFGDIDRNDTGTITQRQLIEALRKQKGLVDLLCEESEQQAVVKAVALQAGAPAKKNDLHRIRKILAQADAKGVQGSKETPRSADEGAAVASSVPSINDTLQMSEFVDLFRRTGLLLEYKTKKQQSRATLFFVNSAFETSAACDLYNQIHHNSQLDQMHHHSEKEREKGGSKVHFSEANSERVDEDDPKAAPSGKRLSASGRPG